MLRASFARIEERAADESASGEIELRLYLSRDSLSGRTPLRQRQARQVNETKAPLRFRFCRKALPPAPFLLDEAEPQSVVMLKQVFQRFFQQRRIETLFRF